MSQNGPSEGAPNTQAATAAAQVFPAYMLVGVTVGDWQVTELVTRPTGATGGTFSVGYLAISKTGRHGFLKALDYSRALQSSDPPAVLQAMTTAFNFEKNILDQCKRSRLSRVVTPLDAGTVQVPGGGVLSAVSYLIFDRADGDLRKALSTTSPIELGWLLRSIHGVIAAARQLHSIRIAHQDIKPSNVLIFANVETRLSDLGRAVQQDAAAPHEAYLIAGDPAYAPPEFFYGHLSSDWNMRRLGCDAYMLGNLIYFMFSTGNMTAAINSLLDPQHRYGKWDDTYTNVLPYVRHAFDRACEQFRQYMARFHPAVAEEIGLIVQQLCDPDPQLRGHPQNRGRPSQYSLERYISRLDFLARKAELFASRG